MSALPGGFTVRETHGVLLRPGVEIRASSDNRGWHSLYASLQTETPFEAYFAGVDDHLVVLHLGGPVSVHRRVQNGEASRVIPPGGLFMMPGGMDFGVRVAGTLQTLHLYLRRAVIEEVAGSIWVGGPRRIELLPRFGDSDPLIERLMLGVQDVLCEDDATAAPYVDYLARAIAAQLVRRHSSVSSSEARKNAEAKLDDRRVADAIDFMQAHLERSIDLAAIARPTGLSPSHFARRFRTKVGQAPHRYLMRLRIERAQRLLSETGTSIAEIAFACGFANQEHLTRLFKRSCGSTPAAYRKSRRS
jgi:AraC family transcriptional regulator